MTLNDQGLLLRRAERIVWLCPAHLGNNSTLLSHKEHWHCYHQTSTDHYKIESREFIPPPGCYLGDGCGACVRPLP